MERILEYRLLITAIILMVATISLIKADFSQSAARLLAPPKVCKNDTLVFKNNAQKKKAIEAMRCLHNYARKKKKRRPLKINPSLSKSANRKAVDIAHCRIFSHNACGRSFDFWIKRHYNLRKKSYSIGENLALGNDPLFYTPRSLMLGWLNSPSHRQALLDPHFRDVGFGVRIGKVRVDKYSKAYKSHIWTAHFGWRK